MRDRDVRHAVVKKILNEHISNPRVLVVHELGLQHGACRVDIAVVNGFLHGFEIKSDADTLLRLPAQIDAYSKALDRASLIVGERHLNSAETLLPDWWGIKVAVRGTRGAVNILTYRGIANNPDVSAFHVAHLLWRDEVLAILSKYERSSNLQRANRKDLYRRLAEVVPFSDLRREIREVLRTRVGWRAGSPRR